MGTAHYIAPEQASGGEAGPAGDVYSLGIVGYECLAGHRPFRAESAVAVAMMQVRDQPPPLPDSVPAYARELIEAALVKDPTKRYSTGGEFAAAVAAVRHGERLPTAGVAQRAVHAQPRPPVLTPPPTPKVAPAPTPPTPTPARAPSCRPHGGGHPGGADDTRVAPAADTAVDARPVELRAGSGRGRTLLLVLFVLLTVAAVVVGAYVVHTLSAGPAPQGMTPGTVDGRTVAL